MHASTLALLEAAWQALGGPPADLVGVQVDREDPGLLPSTLPALSAMVAAVSASTLAASTLAASTQAASTLAASSGAGTSQARTEGAVVIDAEHVALAARSERYARGPGAAPDSLFVLLSRFWRTADGWIRLHANYSWHRERALRVLGCPEDQVSDAIAGWAGVELEDALAAAGALGFVVRTPAEWLDHPQGQAVAALPLLTTTTLEHVGRAGPRLNSAAGGPAEGARVLDLSRVIAGPVATRTLAAWGAQVLRLDSPTLPEIPAQAVETLSGKRSAELDFAQPQQQARLHELLRDADLLVLGYRPGALDRFGLALDDLAERHPQLNVVSLSAWGMTGPWAQRRGFDSLVQCAAGLADQERLGDDRPGVLPAQVLDHATGYLAAAAGLLALSESARGGPARHVRLSLAQTARWLRSLGQTPRADAVELDPERYLVTLAGPSGATQVIAPPGRIGMTPGRVPHWSCTTIIGADRPEWI